MSDIENNCEECRTFEVCLTRHYSLECPCAKCLVKVMCGKSCVSYSKFFNKAVVEDYQITEEKKYDHQR